MKTRLLGGIVALVVAIAGTVMLIMYVQGADKRALANTETQEVYVVQKQISVGTPASSFGNAVVTESVPKSAVAGGTVSNLGEFDAKVASIDFMPGEQLLASRLVDVNALAGQGRVQVPAGFQELTLKLPIERVVGGKLSAGDTVGVLLSFKADDKSNLPDQTQLTFHKVLVTAVQDASGAISDDGDSSSEDSTSSLNANKSTTKDGYLVTLARSSEDVQKVVFAAEFGTVYLSKEPSEATETNPAVLDRGSVFK